MSIPPAAEGWTAHGRFRDQLGRTTRFVKHNKNDKVCIKRLALFHLCICRLMYAGPDAGIETYTTAAARISDNSAVV